MPIETPFGDAPIIPVLLLGIGGYLAWFGAHYFKSDTTWPTDPIKSALTTGAIAAPTYTQEQQQQANLSTYITSVESGGSSASSITANTGNAISDDAMKYVGSGYVYGGNADKIGNWDCSSFVSYVLGHDLSIPLPGGIWGGPGMPPSTHGPTTGSYALYGAQIDQSQVEAGDLVVWSTHMGIAISNTEIVSAQDEQLGVGTSSIAGTTSSLGEPDPRFRRVQLPGNVGGIVG